MHTVKVIICKSCSESFFIKCNLRFVLVLERRIKEHFANYLTFGGSFHAQNECKIRFLYILKVSKSGKQIECSQRSGFFLEELRTPYFFSRFADL